jgi:hypothetical protein
VAAIAVIAVGIALFAISYARVKEDANQAVTAPRVTDAAKAGHGPPAVNKSGEKTKRSSNSG